MCRAFREICRDERLEGRRQGRQEGRQEGIEQERLSSIRSLKANLKMTTEQAMKALDIPEHQFNHYARLI